jgi:orotate phosphoribosyltransferase
MLVETANPLFFSRKEKAVIFSKNHLETLKMCGGYYKCPKGENERLGPLVGYAGKYDAPDGSKKQWVGEIYANFAKAEKYPEVLFHFATCIKGPDLGVDVFCGAPVGGYSFAEMLGLVRGGQAIKAEKKTIALATETMREQSKLVFARHEIESGLRYAVVEDVCNNFSTTDELIELIKSSGGEVVGIYCLLNRSLTTGGVYKGIPLISLVRLQIPEYKQDDPYVVADVEAGHVVLKPKDEWAKLMGAMELWAS